MSDEGMTEIRENTSVNEPKKGKYNTQNLKPFNSERAKLAIEKRWSKSRFTLARNIIKSVMAKKIEEQIDEISAKNVEFMKQGNAEGVQAIQLGLKGIGAHSENEEKAMSMNMKVNADVKKSGTVKLVIEDMTKPEEDQKG